MRNRDAAKLVRALRAIPGAHAVKLVAHPMQEAGLPDVWACVDGRLLLVELKHGSDKLSPAQERQRRLWETAGAAYLVAGPRDTVAAVVERILNHSLRSTTRTGTAHATASSTQRE